MELSERKEAFISASNLKHDKKYNYDKVIFVNMQTKVIIGCPDHGDFLQAPNKHKGGQGCSSCGRAKTIAGRKQTDDVVLARANAIHDFKYKYSNPLVVKGKIQAICKIHGDFQQVLSKHISKGEGCFKCGAELRGSNKKFSTEQFIERSIQMHGETYDYSLSVYNPYPKKVVIICRKHGEFSQVGKRHYEGSGCPKCWAIKREELKIKGFYTFKSEANELHNSKYKYIRSTYTNVRGYLDIICPIHGVFNQRGTNHLSGSGCRKCGRSISISSKEKEIYEFIKLHYDGVIIQSDRKTIMGNKGSYLELDIYLPELKLAIEFNGYYYHNVTDKEKGKRRNYHFNKFKLCRDQGITLISIWDFMYKENRPKYLLLILHKLGLSERVFGRKTDIVDITGKEANDFYKENHFEGGVNSVLWAKCTSKALFYKGKIVMATTYHANDVVRICTLKGVCVLGGVSKLLKHVPKGCTFFSVNDMGSTTDMKGFELVDYAYTRYWWIKSINEYYFRRSCQKSDIASRWGLDMEGHTETSAMKSLGFVKCEDSGLTKWIKV